MRPSKTKKNSEPLEDGIIQRSFLKKRHKKIYGGSNTPIKMVDRRPEVQRRREVRTTPLLEGRSFAGRFWAPRLNQNLSSCKFSPTTADKCFDSREEPLLEEEKRNKTQLQIRSLCKENMQNPFSTRWSQIPDKADESGQIDKRDRRLLRISSKKRSACMRKNLKKQTRPGQNLGVPKKTDKSGKKPAFLAEIRLLPLPFRGEKLRVGSEKTKKRIGGGCHSDIPSVNEPTQLPPTNKLKNLKRRHYP